MSIQDLPAINASLNTLSTVFLLLGYRYIRAGNRTAHRNCMVAALITSTIFLACYLVYHYYAAITKFTEPAWFKPIYLTILISHVILAVVIVPLIIIAVLHAIKGRFEQHKKVTRWAWPLWMYVSVTGVIVYLILYQIFPQTKPLLPIP
ncbi:MAG: DUF420 domain-containing protein [Pedosphaera sp.]|nr:DUF420 domain-containing protein [Pedosphaera sp.]MSU43918.1 DUF420 domain-containing protein [Pedosphaera sp.]